MKPTTIVHQHSQTPGYVALRFKGVETEVPAWAIGLASAIALLLLAAFGFAYFAQKYPENHLEGIWAGLLEDNTSLSLLILAVGLLSVAIFFSQKAFSLGAKATPAWLLLCLFVTYGGSIIAMAAAPSVRLLKVRSYRPLRRSDVLHNLKVNERVHYAIRLIPYRQDNRDYLGIGKLTNLGRCCDPTATDPANQACLKNPAPQRCTQQRYVFVADYAELRNLPVLEAVSKTGLPTEDVIGVSAIIFPLRGRPLYPANARGVLQIIDSIDREHANDPATVYRRFEQLSQNMPSTLLEDHQIPSYSWSSIRDMYPLYCSLAQTFRCAKPAFSAAGRFGTLSRDWHPLGFSRQTEELPCTPAVDLCAINKNGDWDDVVSRQIKEETIARVFLTDNYPIGDIPGRLMIDYDNPREQTIVDLGSLEADKR
jgi:hypothetical protein